MFWANALKPFAAFVLLCIAAVVARLLFRLLPDGRLRRLLYKPIRDEDFAYGRWMIRLEERLIRGLARLFPQRLRATVIAALLPYDEARSQSQGGTRQDSAPATQALERGATKARYE